VAAALAAGEVVRVGPGVAKERPRRAARNAIVLAWLRGVAGSARVQAVRAGLLAPPAPPAAPAARRGRAR